MLLGYNCIKKSDFEKFTSVLTNFVWDKKNSDVDKKISDVDKKSSDVLALDLYTSLW